MRFQKRMAMLLVKFWRWRQGILDGSWKTGDRRREFEDGDRSLKTGDRGWKLPTAFFLLPTITRPSTHQKDTFLQTAMKSKP